MNATTSPSIRLGSTIVTSFGAPYVIAEIGVNHEGSLDRARQLVALAVEGGADAVKFQSYKAERLVRQDSPSYWDLSKEPTRSQYQLFKKYDRFGPAEYEALAAYCAEVGVDFVSTPFDDAAVEYLDPLVPFFKVASADLTNTPFLRRIGRKGKPVVLSAGAATLAEVDVAVQTLADAGCPELALLHCVLNYPTANEDAHLRMITGLRRAFPHLIIGYSDHTLPDEFMTTLVAAYLLGAVVLEKHFTNDKTLPGNDHYHAMDATDLLRFRARVDTVRTLLGDSDLKRPVRGEEAARRHARRSLVLTRDVPAGAVLGEADLTYKRPGDGISPEQWDSVLGLHVLRAKRVDEVLRWEDLAVRDG